MCVSVCVCHGLRVDTLYNCVMLECIRLCVCARARALWNGVEEPGRGTRLRVEGRGLELRVEVESRVTGLRVGVEGQGMANA